MNELKHILYLTTDGLTDPLGQSQILPYLKLLAQYYKITIISFEKPSRLKKEKILQKELSQGSLQWIPLTYRKRPPVVATLWNLYLMKRRAKKLCRQYTVHIVHTRSYLAGLIGLSLMRNFQIKMLFDPRGLWIDERIEGHIWNITNPMYWLIVRYLRKKESSLYQKAHAVVLLTEKARTHLLQHPQLKPKTTLIKVIPCCADETFFNRSALSSDKVDRLRNQLTVKAEDFLLTYHGSLGTWYRIHEVIDFFCALRSKNKYARFLLITHDDDSAFKAYWKKLGLSQYLLISVRAQRNEVPYYLALAHLAVFFINPVFSKLASSPTKMAEIILMDIPFVTNAHIGDIDELIKRTEQAKLVDDFSTNSYLNVLDEILPTKMLTEEGYLKDYFSLQRGVGIYTEIYAELIAGNEQVTFPQQC